ncbi:MAG: hypothetical protein ACP5O7_13395, partial [Phycisphaerae bacterium]
LSRQSRGGSPEDASPEHFAKETACSKWVGPPSGESELSYLDRLGLLTDEERTALSLPKGAADENA